MMSSLFPLSEEPVPVERKPYTGKIIYETRGKAREYRELAANLYTGCPHGCKYCWAPLVLQRNREKFHEDVRIRENILKGLEKDAKGYAAAGETRQVLFCFTCDPYYPGEDEHKTTRQAIQILHQHGLNVCVLTKGGTRAVRDLDLFTPQDSFATTLTTGEDGDSLEWEPNAALPHDRIGALKAFHDAGIPTWVSLEPVLDPRMTMEIIEYTAPVVDEFKVGVLNYHPKAKEVNWKRFGFEVVELLENLDKHYYLKDDLRKAMGV